MASYGERYSDSKKFGLFLQNTTNIDIGLLGQKLEEWYEITVYMDIGDCFRIHVESNFGDGLSPQEIKLRMSIFYVSDVFP